MVQQEVRPVNLCTHLMTPSRIPLTHSFDSTHTLPFDWTKPPSFTYKFILLIPSFDPTHPFLIPTLSTNPYFRTSSPSQAVKSQHSLLFLYKGKLNFAPYISRPASKSFQTDCLLNFHASLEWGTTRYNLISLIVGS